jgi:hypothetical protein
MTRKATSLIAAAALSLMPVAAWSQTGQGGGSVATDRDSPSMPKPGKIQKDTDPEKNGTTQSQSKDGMNKNGQPQK